MSRCLIVVTCASLFAVGCGSGSDLPAVYEVQGNVTGGTGSLEGVVITFTPVDEKGISASGTIGADGSYTLQSSDGRAGVSAGQHKVTLALGPAGMQKAMMDAAAKQPSGRPKMRPGSPNTPSGPPGMQLPFPEKYTRAETSDKTVEVKAEPNVIDIQL